MRYGMIAVTALIAGVLAGCQMPAERGTDDVKVGKDCIETRCVAAYHRDEVPYWTDQRQRFCPSLGRLEVWGAEPEGAYHGAYTKGQFSSTGLGRAAMKALPAEFFNAPLAALLYYSFTAGAGFEPAGMGAIEPVRIEGQRYEAIEVKGAAGRTVTVYKNTETGQFEWVRVADGKGLDWMARSYNPRFHPRLARMVPRKIDIFDVQQGIPAKKLMIEFDYIDVN